MVVLLRVCVALLCAGLLGTAAAQAIDRASLPPEARHTLELIARGGPFPHRRDGVVFNNFEKRLPAKPRGYYREYTVATPGAKNRGARRLVCGGERPRAPVACHYTDDHYKSFRKVRE
jgi:ribonuclease T1